jgi:hypothetical protein
MFWNQSEIRPDLDRSARFRDRILPEKNGIINAPKHGYHPWLSNRVWLRLYTIEHIWQLFHTAVCD